MGGVMCKIVMRSIVPEEVGKEVVEAAGVDLRRFGLRKIDSVLNMAAIVTIEGRHFRSLYIEYSIA